MAILTPTGIIADWDAILHSVLGNIIWSLEHGAGSIGTLRVGRNVSNSIRFTPATTTDEIAIDRIDWAAGRSSSNNRPRFQDTNPPDGRNIDDIDDQVVPLSFYVWDTATLHEFAVADNTQLSAGQIGWSQTNRPAAVVARGTLRIIIANSGQATVVSNFIRGLGTPDAAFTSAVTNLAVQFTDTSAGGTPTSWLWNFGDNTTSTLQNPSHTYASGGTYTVTLTATNAVGATSASATVTTVQPRAVSAVTNQALDWGSDLNYTLPVATGGAAPYTYAVSGLPSWASYNASTRRITGTAAGAAATTTVSVTVTDSNNDAGSATTFTIAVTAIAPPLATNLAGTPGQTSIALTWQQNGDGGDPLTSQVVRFQASGGSAVFQTVPTAATAITLTNLTADTEYSIQIRLFNNTGRSSSATIVVSTTAADLSPSAPTVANQTGVVGTAFSVTLPVGTGGDPPLTYSVSGAPSWATFNTTSRVLSGTPDAVATTTVTYTVTDTDGDSNSSTFNIAISAADLRPSAPTVANQTGVVGTAFSVTLPVGTGGDPPLAYSMSDLPSWASFAASTRVLSGTPNAAATTTVTYTVMDDDGDSDSTTFVITIAADLTPTAPDVGNQAATEGVAFSVTLPAGSGGDPPLAYAVSGRPSWLNFNTMTRVLSGTPTASGTHNLTYTVTDADGDSDDDGFTLTVAATIMTPVAAFTSIVSNLAVQFTDTSTNTPTSWAWNFGDSTTSTDQNPSHTYASGGTYTVTLTATNAGGSDTFTAVVMVAANLVPVAPAVADQTGAENTAFTVTLPVGTGGNAPLSYAVSGAPSWATFNTTSRVLSGTPNAAATTTVTYTVTDADGDMASATFDIAISMGAAGPAQPASPPAIIARDGEVEVVWSPPDDGGEPIIDYLLRHRVGTGAWGNITVTEPPYIVPMLINGETYEFQFRARNSVNSGRYSRSAFAIPTPDPGDLVLSFGAFDFTAHLKTATSVDHVNQRDVDDNFGEVIPIMTRLPATDGAFDQYGTGVAPQAPGVVRVTLWIVARHVSFMHMIRSAIARMSGYGLVTLRRQALNGMVVECQARIRRPDWPRDSTQAAHRQLRVGLEWAVPSPGWLAPTAMQLDHNNLANGDSISVSVDGEKHARPRIRITRAGNTNVTRVDIQRQVAGVMVDQITYTGTIDSNDTVWIDVGRRTVEENGVDAFADFNAESGAWLMLDANAVNTLAIDITPSSARVNLRLEYQAGYYN